jgi:hypothetical protein
MLILYIDILGAFDYIVYKKVIAALRNRRIPLAIIY